MYQSQAHSGTRSPGWSLQLLRPPQHGEAPPPQHTHRRPPEKSASLPALTSQCLLRKTPKQLRHNHPGGRGEEGNGTPRSDTADRWQERDGCGADALVHPLGKERANELQSFRSTRTGSPTPHRAQTRKRGAWCHPSTASPAPPSRGVHGDML